MFIDSGASNFPVHFLYKPVTIILMNAKININYKAGHKIPYIFSMVLVTIQSQSLLTDSISGHFKVLLHHVFSADVYKFYNVHSNMYLLTLLLNDKASSFTAWHITVTF
jgi:hypothetical protein